MTLATDAIIGAIASPSMPGTAYVLFHHVMGECDGVRGVWGYVRGGMGGICNAIAAAARRTAPRSAPTPRSRSILVTRRPGRAASRWRTAPSSSPAWSPRTPTPTSRSSSCIDPKDLPADFVEAVKAIDYASASLKINVALSELPDFTALPRQRRAGPQHRGTIHICPDLDTSSAPTTTPSTASRRERRSSNAPSHRVVDDTLAPPGKHLMSMFVQYAPYKLRAGTWDDEKEKFADRCFEVMGAVRAELPPRGDRPAGAGAAGPGAPLRPDRRQHLPGRDAAQQPLLPAPGARLRRLPHAGPRPLPVRRGGAPRRRGDGRVRVQRGAGDPEGYESGRWRTAGAKAGRKPLWSATCGSGPGAAHSEGASVHARPPRMS